MIFFLEQELFSSSRKKILLQGKKKILRQENQVVLSLYIKKNFLVIRNHSCAGVLKM